MALHMGLNHSQGFVKHCPCLWGGSAIAPQRKDSDCPATPVHPEERPWRAHTGAAATIKHRSKIKQ